MANNVRVSAQRADEIIDDEALAEEDLLDELENGELPAHIREARIQHFKKQADQLGQLKDSGHGKYSELKDEKAFLDLTTTVEKCVVHFYHSDFGRCQIMDKHLEILSGKYFGTKFVKLNAEELKFFKAKFKIIQLPTVMCFVKGYVVYKLIGFEALGNNDQFPTSLLEKVLSLSGVITGVDIDSDDDFEDKKEKKSIFGRTSKKDNDDEDDDDDY